MRRPVLPLLLSLCGISLCGACAGAEDQPERWDPSSNVNDHDLRCPADQSSFAPFSKACRDIRDCATYSHVVSCCGDRVVVGLHADWVSDFEASELACRQAFGDCDCQRGPAEAEDGNGETSGDIVVRCDDGECSTHVSGAAGAPSD